MYIPVESQSELKKQELIRYTNRALETLNKLAQVYSEVNSILGVWYARGLTNYADDVFVSLSKTELQNLMYLFDSLSKFLEGKDAPKADFTQTIHKLRSDL